MFNIAADKYVRFKIPILMANMIKNMWKASSATIFLGRNNALKVIAILDKLYYSLPKEKRVQTIDLSGLRSRDAVKATWSIYPS